MSSERQPPSRDDAQPPIAAPGLSIPPEGQPFIARNNELYWCPWDSRLVFFILYTDDPREQRTAGLYLYDSPHRQYGCVATLEDLPPDTWARVEDEYRSPWPLQLCRSRNGIVSAVWRDQETDIGRPT